MTRKVSWRPLLTLGKKGKIEMFLVDPVKTRKGSKKLDMDESVFC